MNTTIPKVFQINDILSWFEKDELILSPNYQRNSVWNEKAKAYFIDTLLRGLPIPPIFIRQHTDILTRKTTREVVDGQQRMNAIIQYILKESFSTKSSFNKEVGSKKYSDLDDEQKEILLNYSIIFQIVNVKEDALIYDIFARLNSNNYVLNKQEIRNAKYWGEYKVFVYQLASIHREFFIENHIYRDHDFSRMKDVEFLSSLIIFQLKGIIDETPTIVDKIYQQYDQNFDRSEEIEINIKESFIYIQDLFKELNGNIRPFSNKNYLFTLFCVISKSIEKRKINIDNINQFHIIVSNLIDVCNDVTDEEKISLNKNQEIETFKKNHKSRTTNKTERTERITYLAKRLDIDYDYSKI